MTEHEAPLDAKVVAKLLGVSLSTLNAWLAQDEAHPPEDRRFSFHKYRGRKRVWSPEAFQMLRHAIEAESEPGKILGKWRGGGSLRRVPNSELAKQALQKVLDFKARGDPTNQRSRRTAKSAPKQVVVPDDDDEWSPS